jgi:16S rRNA (cytidine1402-2'-O)-methyltransferase
MLYLIATPIGNLEDITYRAVKILSSVDYILCEDTRISITLLKKYNITTPLFSFHKFNEKKEEQLIINDLINGKNIALISDAGTPLISDPGQHLIKLCMENKIPFTAIPGACSIINALTLSAMQKDHFQFLGFFPKEKHKQEHMIRKASLFDGITIFFEAPHRLLDTLKLFSSTDLTITICREMTKLYEEIITNNASSLLTHFQNKDVKGEIVLLIEGNQQLDTDNIASNELISLIQENFSCPLKEAIKIAAKLKKMPKSKLYRTQFKNNPETI